MRARIAIFGSVLSLLGTTVLAQAVSAPPFGMARAGTPPTPAALTTPPPAAAPSPAAAAGAAPPAEDHMSDSVAAIVNDAPITEYELRQRVLLFIATSGLQPTPDNLTKLRPKVLEELESEQLKLQEARRKSITVSAADVDKAIERITTENKLSRDQLADMLHKFGVDMSTLRTQIAVQIAWQKAVQDQFQERVNITPADVDAELARQMEGADKPHFLVSAIFLPVENPDMDAKVLKDAQDIYAQLQSGANFGTVARQFSQNPTAASGGDMGWVHEGQMAPELDAALVKMQPGTISPPVRSNGGYYILGLRQRQEGVGTKLPDPATVAKSTGPLTVDRVLLPLPPGAKKDYVETVLKIAMQVREHIDGCAQLPELSQKVRGMVYQDLSKLGIRIADLDPHIQDAIQKTGPGEATPPFTSSAGVEMMVRCDHRPPAALTAFTPPTRDQVEESLFEDQISLLARRYLRDLRRQANVEVR